MKLSRSICFFAGALLFTLTLRSADTAVEITPELRGAWTKPDGAWDGRVVLMLHGFASDMDDAGGLTKRLAAELAAHGIASLRINFRGEGDALRTKIESTLATRLEDTASAHAFIVKQPGVKADHVGAQGWSLGATTAIITGGQHPDWFRTISVWSSPSGDQFEQVAGNETGRKARRDGEATQVIPGWKSITTKRDFYESFRGFDVDQSLAKYPGAFLSVRGSEDMLPQHEIQFMKLAKGRPAEAVLIAGGDHTFHVFQPDGGESARVLEVTLAWFERTL